MEESNGAGGGTRTPDPRITNALLYQLSYTGSPNTPKARPEPATLSLAFV